MRLAFSYLLGCMLLTNPPLARAADPAGTFKSVKSVKSVTSVKSAKSVQPDRPAQPAKPVKPVLDPYRHRAMLVGRWLMSRPTPDGGEATWLIEREPGGTYRRKTRVIQAGGEVTEYEDVGRWGVVNRILFTMMRGRTRPGQSALDRASPADPYSYDAFEITGLSKAQLRLLSQHTGDRFTEKRVTKNFRLRNAPGQ